MKILSTSFAAHLEQECLTLAQCWKLTRRDGGVMGFTSHDQDISFEGVAYKAESGVVSSAVASQASLAVDNLDIEGILQNDLITEADILSGRYDFAQVESFLINYTDHTQGKLSLRIGWLGEVQLDKQRFVAELRGITQKLSQHIGELYSPVCRAQLGDERCKVDVAAYQQVGSLTAVQSRSHFTDVNRTEAAGHYDRGVIEFTSGSNQGLLAEVKFFQSGGVIQAALPLPHLPVAGDSYRITQGCDKTVTTCINRYNNALNFRGEPHVPGLDKVLQTATTRQG